MDIVYFSNFLNHHQKLVSDAINLQEGITFTFVEMVPMYEWLKKGGYSDYSQVSYVLRAWENDANRKHAIELAKKADVALFGGPEVLFLEVIRAKSTDKISFEVSERWLKKGWINFLSPRLIKSQFFYHTLFKYKSVYKLCASAFCANDQYKMRSFIGKCFKWGYFTKIDSQLDFNRFNTENIDTLKLMWCSRFINWKHPELPIYLAQELKKKGYKFILDMYGSGDLFDKVLKLAKQLDVQDLVNFRGNLANDKILEAMREHHLFLFTSDRNEGWGAVANEAMSNGCLLVASNHIGSIPFLVKDKENGLVFNSSKVNTGFYGDSVKVDNDALNSLLSQVLWCFDNISQCSVIAQAGYKTLRDTWSPDNAAHSLLLLIHDLIRDDDTHLTSGPCSKAYPISI